MEFSYTLKNGASQKVIFSNDDLDAFCKTHIGVMYVREQTAFMAMGFAGMVEHSYLSRNWIANNALFCQAYNKIISLAGEPAAREICDRMKSFAGLGACTEAGR